MDAIRANATPDGMAASEEPQTGPTTTVREIRAAQRDPQALATIYATWFDPIYHYCLRRLESPGAAEDTTSRVFERVLKALPTYQVYEERPGETIRSWLFAIAHNTIVDHHRRRRFHSSLDRLLHPFHDRPSIEVAASDRSPEDQALGEDTGRAVQRALGHLPDRQRRIVELRLTGLTGPEIAHTLNITHPAVKSAQFRAYVTMREVLTELGYAPDVREDHYVGS